MEKELKEKTIEFVKAFEEVFHDDWKYTMEMLGIYNESDEQKAYANEMGLEEIDIISKEGTFLQPNVEDETEDWGNRGRLLKAYQVLKKEIS